jgi:hypothetical protein
MGTRNLTAVFSDGAYRIAQYGQWDGHPSGQGKTALEFCRKHLTTPEGRERFKAALGKVRFASNEEIQGLYEQVGVPRGTEWVTSEQAERFNARWPHFSRNHGAKILGLVMTAEGEVLTRDETAFAGDSLFCEWAYVVDLDAGTFEVFKGFNESPAPEGERFAKAPRDPGSSYYPVRLLAKWALSDLPSTEALLALDKEDE